MTDPRTFPEQPTTAHVARLSRDLRDASYTLSDDEARFLVDAYYIIQEDRKRSGNQVRSMGEEPHLLLTWFFEQNHLLEAQLKGALDRYSDTKQIGRWMKSLYGVGPVISAGLMAHVDIKKAETAGDIYRFAGLDPSTKWEKGQKRPHNASLKTLCWKIGQSFMKFSNEAECYYGPHYKKRKRFEVKQNEAGTHAELAARLLPKFDKATEAYDHLTKGRLPPAHVDARARRWTAKLFLSHVHEVWYEIEFGKKPPACYALSHLAHRGHTHYIPPPNWPMTKGA